jgi:3-oxoacid CoA-transferase subunit B
MSRAGLSREEMAIRAAQELKEGDYVNLGQGMPTLVCNYLPPGLEIMLHGENGIIGIGPYATGAARDQDLINAGKEPVTLLPGASFFSSDLSFLMLRGGHLDVCILGAYQVSEKGDIANWRAPGRTFGGMGGAMDIAAGARFLIALMTHTHKDGTPKIVRECSYPLTARQVVHRIITDLAVIDVTKEGLLLREILPGLTVKELQEMTEPPLRVAGDLKALEVKGERVLG